MEALRQEPKLLYVGDPHGEFDGILEEAIVEDVAVVILLGDQTPVADLAGELGSVATKTWYILGNHDCELPTYLERHQALADRCLHGRVVELSGILVAGLGGVFRSQIWMPPEEPKVSTRHEWQAMHPHRPLSRRHACTIFPEDIQALSDQKADVLVTHEAPESHPLGFASIGDLARALGVRLVVHGHHHQTMRGSIEPGIEVIGLGRGSLWLKGLT